MFSSPAHSPRSVGPPCWPAAPFAVDTGPHEWAVSHRPAWARRAAVVITVTGSGVPACVLAAAASWAASAAFLVLLWRRRPDALAVRASLDERQSP